MAIYRIALERSGERFEARAGETLLQAAERAGVTLPTSCRNGTCRTCMRQMRAGAVEYIIEWPGLTREEKGAGLVLPCVAQARADIVLV